jgi:PIN domain nuclease of toxin-antitoxin system
MKLLLDTCAFLWFIGADRRLSPSAIEAIRSPANEVYLSVVSLWEITVKNQLGKLPLPHPPHPYIQQQRERHRISSLPLDESSVAYLDKLPSIHRDPFDRMLICQAMTHNLTLVTKDEKITAYPVAVLQ